MRFILPLRQDKACMLHLGGIARFTPSGSACRDRNPYYGKTTCVTLVLQHTTFRATMR